MRLLGNGRLITRDSGAPYFENGGVVMEGDSIVEVGEYAALLEKYPQAELIDARGGVIMPGLINTHDHLRSIFSRGADIAAPPKKTFLQLLEEGSWALDRKMKRADVSAAADCAFIECVENGVTTVFEHHASYGEVPGSLFAIEESAARHGVRVCLCYDISDREGERKMKQAVKENVEYIEHMRQTQDDRALGVMGLNAQFTLSDATLDYCASKAPQGAGWHLHVAEAALDVTDCLNKHGIRPLFRLYDFGIIGNKTICSHCTHVNEREMDVLKNNDALVIHNPESSMSRATGCPQLLKLLERGIVVGLGSDGCGADMLRAFKTASLLHKHELSDATAVWNEIPTLLFENNAKIASRFFKRPLGVLKPGAHADLIVLDYTPVTPMTADNFNSHILFGMNGAMTRTTIIGGETRMLDRELIGVDKQQEYAHAAELSAELWRRMKKK